MEVDIELDTSISNILNGKDPILQQLNQGIKMKAALDVVSQFKTFIFACLKDESNPSSLVEMAVGMSPSVLLQTNAKIEVEYDDFEDIK
jgi:hypothetical protein